MHRGLKIIYSISIPEIMILTVLLLAFFPLVLSSPGPDLVYQEDANTTSLIGSWTNGANTYDGNWNTYGTALAQTNYLLLNYTKPAGAQDSSIWEIKTITGAATRTNYTMSSYADCWALDPLQFKVESDCTGPASEPYTWWYCWDSDSWNQLASSTGSTCFVYEEAMWWDVVAADTCTCAGSNENWEIDMADYCELTDPCELGTGKLSFTGSGNVSCDTEINTTNLGDPGANGIIYILDGCKINIR